MGNNFWDKSGIKREEVIKNIFQINEITKSLSFMKKMNLYLLFELDDDTPIKRNSRKIIKVFVYDYDSKKGIARKRSKSLIITIENFYKYFNMLMNSKSVFLAAQLNESFQKGNSNLGEDESGFCPICSENKVNLSLPCSHFFCEKCISAWVVKSESCPICRFQLKLNKKSPSGVSGAHSWNIIDDVDQEQMEKENLESLILLTKSIFNQK